MFLNQSKDHNINKNLKNIGVDSKIRSMDLISPILVKQFDNFIEIKEKTLDLINQSKKSNSEFFPQEHVNISKSDYNFNSDPDREWLWYIKETLAKNIYVLSNMIGYDSVTLSSAWFQQYEKESTHGWHIHPQDHYSGVFYLEMPQDGPQTQFYNTLNKSVYSLGLQEGDIAIFPSYLPHRSGPNKSIKRKTIISFNFGFNITNDNINILNELVDRDFL